MPLVIAAALVAWFVFGSPMKTVANIAWKYSPAPWEEVDGFYYPDRSNLAVSRSAFDLSSLEACRSWAYSVAASEGDPNMLRGDYECGVGGMRSEYGFNVYRITVR